MPLTKYRCTFAAPDHPDKVVVFSTRTAASLLLPRELLDDFDRVEISEEERGTLVEQGFLVESAEAERREILAFVDELAVLDRSCKPTVVLNFDCNLACVYCFEGTRKGKHYLSDETADRLLAYLEHQALPGRDQLHVTFYGGEPLLSTERILDLAPRMRALCDAAGIPFRFSLVTNGTLLTRGRVGKLRPLGLTSANVTLDGPRETHDAGRPFRSGKGSYDLILGNLAAVADLVDLQIGGNFTQDNYREFPRLFDDLAARGLGPDTISDLRFDPVFREAEGFAPPDFRGGCTTFDEPWLLEASVFLREETLRRGYRTGRTMPSRCMVDYPGRPVINYDGALYTCTGFIGREQCKVGDIKGTDLFAAGAANRSVPIPSWQNEECLSCAYLPLCFGGCRYMALLRGGTTNGLDCRKAYFDAVLERLVLQDIRYRVPA